MKCIIASDIHGSALWCAKLLKLFESGKADKLILLGDLLYHGPRNALPDEYCPQKTAQMLNEFANIIVCVRGNCDSEVDQMMLSFPILAEYAVWMQNGQTVYLQHGHKECFALSNGMTVLSGHTHIPLHEEKNGVLFLNPGSVAIPKQSSRHSCMIWEDGRFCWMDIENNHIFEHI